MQTIENGYRGARLLMNLNWDRLLFVATLAGALWFSAFLTSL